MTKAGTSVVIETSFLVFGVSFRILRKSRKSFSYVFFNMNSRTGQFGKAIGQFQGVQFQLAEMRIELEAARLMVYNAARLKDSGADFIQSAAMAKYYSSKVAEKVTSMAIDLFGGNGFTKEYPVEKFWRDSKIGQIYEGTSNMQKQTIAKLVLAE